MLRSLLTPFAMFLALTLIALPTLAQDEKAPKEAKPKATRVSGVATSVGDASVTIQPKKEGSEAVTVTADDKTAVKVDGKAATLADIKVGYTVNAMVVGDGAATKIDAFSPEETARKAEEAAKKKAERDAAKGDGEGKKKDKDDAGDGDGM